MIVGVVFSGDGGVIDTVVRAAGAARIDCRLHGGPSFLAAGQRLAVASDLRHQCALCSPVEEESAVIVRW